MALSKFVDAGLPLVALFIAACSNNNIGTMQDNTLPVGLNANDIVLPIEVGRYRTWHCQDGTTIDTQFSDNSKAVLKVRYQGRELALAHRASRIPAIYENRELAFFSDGESAVIGKPLSDIIIHGGCHL